MTSSRSYRGAAASERVHRRRTSLVDAAVEAFGTVGYRKASVESICSLAGVSKRYFYESFTDSEALLLASYERCADEIHTAMVDAVAAAGDDLSEQVRAALGGYFRAIDADQKRARITLLEILGVSPAVDQAWAEQTRRFAASVRALAAPALAESAVPSAQQQVIAEGIIGAITTTATLWLLQARRSSVKQLVDATHLLVVTTIEGLRG